MRPYVEKRGAKYRVRARGDDGKLIPLGSGYDTAEDAEQAGWEAIIAMGRKEWVDPRKGDTTLHEWAEAWLPAQDVRRSTLDQYGYLIRTFILPFFGSRSLTSLAEADNEINAWEKQVATKYAASTAAAARARLATMLGDAAKRRLIARNPAERQRGRGRKGDNRLEDAKEEAWTDPLGALLIAERAALLTGRDDEFVMLITDAYTGMRFGELIGLERQYVRLSQIRVEWQLYQLNSGAIIRTPPKDGSRRSLDIPPFLSDLLSRQRQANPGPATQSREICACVKDMEPGEFGHPVDVHLFRGPAVSRPRLGAVPMSEVARIAGVSATTVSNVFNRPDIVKPETVARIRQIMKEVGFTGQQTQQTHSPHWRRDGFRTWVMTPATEGRYPAKGKHPAHPVPVMDGVPVRGRGASKRATESWLPITPGLTVHGLRHSHKTWMQEDEIHQILQHDRLGHEMDGIGATYTHVTPAMRRKLLDALTRRWEDALRRRAQLWPRSRVVMLDGLLESYRSAYRRYRTVVDLCGAQIISHSVPSGHGKAHHPFQVAGF
ncbi:LacI family DNA-binding transcriptional regulator [Allonocardiopsis opalescens]|uniref:Regulatory LacI family protein n=1 Tax=Allonocardiopsis opalescens TaxID=1144618 RepID=A0A2T0PP79_9ACTN|nr:LacI family DNA-binding transcriptional regulator [Allonocardiopsis opalescens]PRX90703.1 regulatory LacI family protein [Allonocardiopsis opalescens]